jgi:hypothetical protein
MIQPTLDLDPQDGDLDFIVEVEATFGVRLTKDHVADWKTLGDVHKTLTAVLPEWTADGACPTSMAFNRLRRALVSAGHERRQIKPSSALAAFANGRPARLLRRLEKQTGLQVPACHLKALGGAGAWMSFIGLIGWIPGALNQEWLLVGLCALIGLVGLGLLRLDRGRLPPGLRTLGDLAERSAALSRTTLRQEGARRMPNDIWTTLAAIVAEHSEWGAANPHDLGPETYLFRSAYERDRRAVS